MKKYSLAVGFFMILWFFWFFFKNHQFIYLKSDFLENPSYSDEQAGDLWDIFSNGEMINSNDNSEDQDSRPGMESWENVDVCSHFDSQWQQFTSFISQLKSFDMRIADLDKKIHDARDAFFRTTKFKTLSDLNADYWVKKQIGIRYADELKKMQSDLASFNSALKVLKNDLETLKKITPRTSAIQKKIDAKNIAITNKGKEITAKNTAITNKNKEINVNNTLLKMYDWYRSLWQESESLIMGYEDQKKILWMQRDEFLQKLKNDFAFDGDSKEAILSSLNDRVSQAQIYVDSCHEAQNLQQSSSDGNNDKSFKTCAACFYGRWPNGETELFRQGCRSLKDKYTKFGIYPDPENSDERAVIVNDVCDGTQFSRFFGINNVYDRIDILIIGHSHSSFCSQTMDTPAKVILELKTSGKKVPNEIVMRHFWCKTFDDEALARTEANMLMQNLRDLEVSSIVKVVANQQTSCLMPQFLEYPAWKKTFTVCAEWVQEENDMCPEEWLECTYAWPEDPFTCVFNGNNRKMNCFISGTECNQDERMANQAAYCAEKPNCCVGKYQFVD